MCSTWSTKRGPPQSTSRGTRPRPSASRWSKPAKWSMCVCVTNACETRSRTRGARRSISPRSKSSARRSSRTSTTRPGSLPSGSTRRGSSVVRTVGSSGRSVRRRSRAGTARSSPLGPLSHTSGIHHLESREGVQRWQRSGSPRSACRSTAMAPAPTQSLENPLGRGGEALHAWALADADVPGDVRPASGGSDRRRRRLRGARASTNVGAWILGRNMFGPVRGPWPDDSWKGWWGDKPPYHAPVFVLTHHARAPLEMDGRHDLPLRHRRHRGRARARDARRPAARTCASAAASRPSAQYLRAGLIDELHLAFSPVLLGGGEALLAGIDLAGARLRGDAPRATPNALHVVLTKRESSSP